eukprot:jgi/Hompol1/565/HPOL_005355-RA
MASSRLPLPLAPYWIALFEKAKMGFLMGGTVGMTVGFLYGSYSVLKFGPPPGKTYLGTVGMTMVQHGTMLGFFLSIGSLLRNEEIHETSKMHSIQQIQRMPVVILPKAQIRRIQALEPYMHK